jgi:hypothetical protein
LNAPHSSIEPTFISSEIEGGAKVIFIHGCFARLIGSVPEWAIDAFYSFFTASDLIAQRVFRATHSANTDTQRTNRHLDK